VALGGITTVVGYLGVVGIELAPEVQSGKRAGVSPRPRR
jgi:hypothetical protein